jgi:Ca2+/Na+ antiporter
MKELLTNKYSLIFFIIIAFVYNIIVYRSKNIVVVMFLILLYFVYLYDIFGKLNNKELKNKKDLITEHTTKFIDNEIKTHSNGNHFIDNLNIYPIYNKPKKFIFLKHDKFLENILYDLRYIEQYDKGDYFKLIILIENFLKIYYNLIIDRYDVDYVDILLDTRKEILNIMYNFKVDAPMFSKKGKRLDDLIHKNLLKTQSYTYKKIKNINKKYPTLNLKSPAPIHKDDLYDNYKIIV